MDLRETIGQFHEAYGRHDIDAVLAYLAADVVIQFPTSQQPMCGKEAIRPVWTMLFSHVTPDIRQQVVSAVVQGNTAAYEFVETGTLTLPPAVATSLQVDGGGRPYRLEAASFVRVNTQGLMDRIRTYWDTANFADQIGIDISVIRSMQDRAHAG
jgi:steroid delta-isomerase-like uncharacterized protein